MCLCTVSVQMFIFMPFPHNIICLTSLANGVVEEGLALERAVRLLNTNELIHPMLGQVQVLSWTGRLVVTMTGVRNGFFDLSASWPIIVAGNRNELRRQRNGCSPSYPVVLAAGSLTTEAAGGGLLLAFVVARRHGWYEEQVIAVGRLLQLVPVLPGTRVGGAVAGRSGVEAVEEATTDDRRVLFGAAFVLIEIRGK